MLTGNLTPYAKANVLVANRPELFAELGNMAVVYEGLHTYGGLAGRDLEGDITQGMVSPVGLRNRGDLEDGRSRGVSYGTGRSGLVGRRACHGRNSTARLGRRPSRRHAGGTPA